MGGGRTKKADSGSTWPIHQGSACRARMRRTTGLKRGRRVRRKRQPSGEECRGAKFGPAGTAVLALAAICGCSFLERSLAMGTSRAKECGGWYSDILYSRPHRKTQSARSIAVPDASKVGFRNLVHRCTERIRRASTRSAAHISLIAQSSKRLARYSLSSIMFSMLVRVPPVSLLRPGDDPRHPVTTPESNRSFPVPLT